MLQRPFTFPYHDRRWLPAQGQYYFWPENTPGKWEPRVRTIQVIELTSEHVTYQVFQAGITHNASPMRVKAETFRRFFQAALEAAASSIKEQINGA